MYPNVRHWEDDPVGFVVDRLFPDLHVFAREEYWEQYPEHKNRFEKAKADADRFIDSIAAMPPGQFFQILESEKQKSMDERVQLVLNLDKDRFFNDVRANTDWDYWSKISYWTAEEAVAISFGKDPRAVTLEKISRYEGNSIFVASFHAQLELIKRAVEVGQLNEKNTPPYLLGWAERTGFLMHPMAFDAVKARGLQIADWKTEYDKLSAFLERLLTERDQTYAEITQSREELDSIFDTAIELHEQNQMLEARLAELDKRQRAGLNDVQPRERKSMLKMILAMAMKKYQFDPSKAKNGATANIVSAVIQIGLRLDEDTARKFLNEAKVLLEDQTE
ncbi:hypothetical protein IHQ71_02915 [Rhizobium sp. TH2]|uniref:hypothetical protein n=1 Tax=Rhizobium sp. TH2 TaxID=2775403 RepID=UPI0021580C9B|nr:hypothetical protein [Rhizobium sp. TH2]UVC09595.1 hypothetical protein IHQ71_02915 [Rhizobium sp. TH2]